MPILLIDSLQGDSRFSREQAFTRTAGFKRQRNHKMGLAGAVVKLGAGMVAKEMGRR